MAKNPAAVALGRKGGTAAAKKLSKAARVARATKAGQASQGKGGWPKGKRRGLVALLLAVGLTLPVSAGASDIPLALGGALTIPGCTIINGQCFDPPSITVATTLPAPALLGGTLDVSLTTFHQSIYGVSTQGGRIEGFNRASLVFTWDANGDGLNLDLRDYLGLTLGRITSDGGYLLHARFYSLPESWYGFSASLDDATAIGDPQDLGPHPYRYGTYAFDRFTPTGTPDWQSIRAIQLELWGCCAMGRIDTVSLTQHPVPVPDGGPTLVLLALGVGLVALWPRAS